MLAVPYIGEKCVHRKSVSGKRYMRAKSFAVFLLNLKGILAYMQIDTTISV